MMSAKTILVTSLYCRAVIALMDQHLAIFKQIQTVENGLSPADMIACAFRAKDKIYSGFKVTGETGECVGLDLLQMTNTTFPSTLEYYEKEAQVTIFSELKSSFKRRVTHPLFSEIKLRDKFQFVFNKSNTDIFGIAFKENVQSILVFLRVFENECKMLDQYGGVKGEEEQKPYEFSAFKVYNVTFEVFETNWQIYKDGQDFATFDHRYPYKDIAYIEVKTGPYIDYVTKYENPKLPI